MIGRALIRRGEIVFYIDASVEGGIFLLPCETWDVTGDPNPETWTYRCTVGGPQSTVSYDRVPAAGRVAYILRGGRRAALEGLRPALRGQPWGPSERRDRRRAR